MAGERFLTFPLRDDPLLAAGSGSMTLTTTQPVRTVTIGVDTHSLIHHAAAIDQDGRMPGDQQFPASLEEYLQLLDGAAAFGMISVFGVERTGSYGAGLTRHVLASGIDVVEVNRGRSQVRHRVGKSVANKVIYLMATCRLRYDSRSQAYRDRRRAQGHSSSDAIRSLKRFIARELFYALKRDLQGHPSELGHRSSAYPANANAKR